MSPQSMAAMERTIELVVTVANDCEMDYPRSHKKRLNTESWISSSVELLLTQTHS